MIIRLKQIEALSTAVEQNFQLQLVKEMHDFAPWDAQVLGDDGTWAREVLSNPSTANQTDRATYLWEIFFVLGG